VSRDEQIQRLYAAFNGRDIDALLAAMTDDVRWPNAWEGGWLSGRAQVRDYWERQWQAIDPNVEPIELAEQPDGSVSVRVHQVVRDKDGGVIADQEVVHVYRFSGDLIAEMAIEGHD
jgi:hypothetical protein